MIGRLLFAVCALALPWSSPAWAQATYHVATTGSDVPGGGSAGQPWATITYALGRVPDGSLILVAPGTYNGRIRIRGNFDPPVTVRSQVPYVRSCDTTPPC
ncbi:DUF1565 domain-containing protein [Pseudofulvimonas gallinarii]|uniref:DUF1565 domain-containing protein n=1 Tax=Pseudofulvimonas gallinarii TaxID=634155 RepID=UPI000F48A45D|nr:DUF1565 domain-containing protein [Pseudofulvimonas gallinarii]